MVLRHRPLWNLQKVINFFPEKIVHMAKYKSLHQTSGNSQIPWGRLVAVVVEVFYKHVGRRKWQAHPGRLRQPLEGSAGPGLGGWPGLRFPTQLLSWGQEAGMRMIRGMRTYCPWMGPFTDDFRWGVVWAPWHADNGCQEARALETPGVPDGSTRFSSPDRTPGGERLRGTEVGVSLVGGVPAVWAHLFRFGSQAVDIRHRSGLEGCGSFNIAPFGRWFGVGPGMTTAL